MLLIVAALTQSELTDLSHRAHALELDVLCEVHDGDELQRALDAGCNTIGVNNRNLHTLQIDLNTSLELAELMPGDVLKVAESGIENAERHWTASRGRFRGFPDWRISNARSTSRSGSGESAGTRYGGCMTWTKICGTTNLGDANLAVSAGADGLGFIFAPSPRQIQPETAAQIIAALPAKIAKIGVTVNQSPEAVANLAQTVGLTGIQLQGDESGDQLCAYRSAVPSRKIIKTLQARQVLAGGEEYLYQYLRQSEFLDALLLDAGVPGQPGGTGVPFDWNALAPLVANIKRCIPVIIAGGLTPENVPEALRLFEPWGVDVVSGVESAIGRKDETKLRAFVNAVRTASVSQPAASR